MLKGQFDSRRPPSVSPASLSLCHKPAQPLSLKPFLYATDIIDSNYYVSWTVIRFFSNKFLVNWSNDARIPVARWTAQQTNNATIGLQYSKNFPQFSFTKEQRTRMNQNSKKQSMEVLFLFVKMQRLVQKSVWMCRSVTLHSHYEYNFVLKFWITR